MPTPEQIEAYKQIKSDGTLDTLPADKAAKYKSIYEPIINPVSKTETSARMSHQGVTGGFQDEFAGIGSVIGNTVGANTMIQSLMGPAGVLSGIGLDLISDLSKGNQTLESIVNTYRQGRDQAREVNQYAERSNPKTAIAANVVGSLPLMAIAPGSSTTTLGRLGTSALVGGAYGGGVSNADLTKGDIGEFAKDVGIGAGLGVAADVAMMGVTKGVKAIANTETGKKVVKAIGNKIPFLKTTEDIAIRKDILQNQTLEEFVNVNGGKIDDKLVKKAIDEGFPVSNSKELQSMLLADKAAKDAGQRGVVRTMAMTPDELDGYMAQKFNFVPSKGSAPAPKVFDAPEDKLLMQKVGSELNEGVGTGSPDMTKFTPITPENVGGAPTADKVANLNINQIPTKYEDFRGWVQQMTDPNKDLLYQARLKGQDRLSRADAVDFYDSIGINPLQNMSAKEKAQVLIGQRELGQALGPREAAFLRQTMNEKVYPDLIALRNKIDIKDPKQKELWLQELGKAFQLQSNIAGGTSEAARTVAFAKQVSPMDKLREQAAKVFQENMKNPKAQDRILDMAGKLDVNNPQAIGEFISTLRRTRMDKISGGAYELWINSILSNPQSHMRNMIGNTVTTTTIPAEKALSAFYDKALTDGGKLLEALTDGGKLLKALSDGEKRLGKTVERERYLGEASSNITGSLVGLKQATLSFFKTLAGKESKIPGSKLDFTGSVRTPYIPGKIGKIIRFPGDALRAEDEFFKTILYSGETTSLAARQAVKEGLKGKALDNRIVEILKDPSHVIHEAGVKAAQMGTFQTPLGSFGKTISFAIKEIPGLRYVQPFLTTGANILKYGVKRTPFGLARLAKASSKGEIADILAQGTLGTAGLIGAGGGLSALKDISEKKVDRPASQPNNKELSAWTMATGGLAQIYADGNLTGGAPVDPEQRKVFFASGKVPYAMKIGDQWISFKDLGPVGISMGIMADTMQSWNSLERDDAAKALGLMFWNGAKTYLNQSYTSGLSDLANAYSNPEVYLPRLTNRIATGFIPYSGAMRFAGNVVDPTLRRPEDLKQAVQNVLPWTRDMVPPMYDVWGDPVKITGTVAERIFSPIRRNEATKDKATQEIDRLDIQPGSISKSINKDLSYTDPAYHLAQQMRGQYAKMFIDRYVNSSGYDKMDDVSKSMVLDKLFAKAGEVTRKRLGVTGNSKAMKGLMINLKRAQESGDEGLQDTIKERMKTVLSRELQGTLPTTGESYSISPIETKRSIE